MLIPDDAHTYLQRSLTRTRSFSNKGQILRLAENVEKMRDIFSSF